MRKIFTSILALLGVFSCKKDSDQPVITIPEVSTVAVTDTGLSSANFHGALLNTGNAIVGDYGFCYSINHNPSLTDSKISDGSATKTLAYFNPVTGLSEHQIYYVRAYATNEKGTAYGQELSFATLSNPLKDGLVAYYPFNGNTNDESGNNNNGIASGGSFTSDNKNNLGKAYSFGGSDYIQVPNSASLSSIGNNFTIAAWVYNESQLVSVVCKSAFNDAKLQFRLFSDAAILFANNAKAADFLTTLNPLNTWKHIVITSDGTTAKYYLNGVFMSSMPLHDDSDSFENDSDLYIGADTHGTTEFHTGKLDEIRIYNRVLSDDEVQEIYNF